MIDSRNTIATLFFYVRNGDPGKFLAFSKIFSAVCSSEVGNPNLCTTGDKTKDDDDEEGDSLA